MASQFVKPSGKKTLLDYANGAQKLFDQLFGHMDVSNLEGGTLDSLIKIKVGLITGWSGSGWTTPEVGGSMSYTGIGFKPRLLIIGITKADMASLGASTGAGAEVDLISMNHSGNGPTTDGAYMLRMSDSAGGSRVRITMQSMDSDGFTIYFRYANGTDFNSLVYGYIAIQ